MGTDESDGVTAKPKCKRCRLETEELMTIGNYPDIEDGDYCRSCMNEMLNQ